IEYLYNQHYCLVQKPLWESLYDLHAIMPEGRMDPRLVKSAVRQVLLAPDYLHTERKLVHTDIKPDNIMQELDDHSILDTFVQTELDDPIPRKMVGDRTIYLSRLLEPPRTLGRVLLCDFGSAVQGEEKKES
ncbi:serine/threonine protein kinase variant, partial [Penicillium vulpinum]|uniref:serine/threonine protein kinase variant n=1 Tax=Penicillium vulpinum TaxID=29845 RepID=UPI0025471708